MHRFLWSLIRFCLSAWLGAAVLFVVTGVREVTSPEFDAITKNHLAAIRFPAYYLFGFSLTGLSLAAGAVLILTGRRQWTVLVVSGLLTGTLTLMVIDYTTIFRPLLAMMLNPAQVLDVTFRGLHQQSKYINFAGLLLALPAALIAVSTDMAPANSQEIVNR